MSDLSDFITTLKPSFFIKNNLSDGITDQSQNNYSTTGQGSINIGGSGDSLIAGETSSTIFDGVDDLISTEYKVHRNLYPYPKGINPGNWDSTTGVSITNGSLPTGEGLPALTTGYKFDGTIDSGSQNVTSQVTSLEVGKTYTLSFYAWMQQQGATVPYATIDGQTSDNFTNTWERYSITFTATQETVEFEIVALSFSIVWVTGILLEEGSDTNVFFDGDGIVKDFTYTPSNGETVWEGIENQSISARGPFVNNSVRVFMGVSKRASDSTDQVLFGDFGYLVVEADGDMHCSLDDATEWPWWGGAAPDVDEWFLWTFIVDTIDNKVELFINGESKGEHAISSSWRDDVSQKLNVGGKRAPRVDYFHGNYSYFAVFEHAISDSDIQKIYTIAIKGNPKKQKFANINIPKVEWRFYLADSQTMDRIGDLTRWASGKNLEVSLNRPGSLGFSMHLSGPYVDQIIPIKNCVIAEKNNKVVWSGPIWSRQRDFGTSRMNVNCVGWFQLLHKRFLGEEKTFKNTADGQIAFELLDYANSQSISGTPYPTVITKGTNTSLVKRDVKYELHQNIGQAIESLIEIENGFDYEIDPVTRKMNIRSWNEFADRTDVIFGYNWGPRNLQSFSDSAQADDLANQYLVLGKNGIAEAHDDESLPIYGLHQQVIALTDVTDIKLLGAVAQAELAVFSKPTAIVEFTPKRREPNSSTVPSIFENYQIGDKVYVTAKTHGSEVINQAVRIFGASISIDESGNETVNSIKTVYN